jgi:hypothetical protein
MTWFTPKIEIVEVRYCGCVQFAIRRTWFSERYLDLSNLTSWHKLTYHSVGIVSVPSLEEIKPYYKKYKEGWVHIKVRPLDKSLVEMIIHELE